MKIAIKIYLSVNFDGFLMISEGGLLNRLMNVMLFQGVVGVYYESFTKKQYHLVCFNISL